MSGREQFRSRGLGGAVGCHAARGRGEAATTPCRVIGASRFLPVAPRPREGELLSSWRGRVACRYGVAIDGLAVFLRHADRRLGVATRRRGFCARSRAAAGLGDRLPPGRRRFAGARAVASFAFPGVVDAGYWRPSGGLRAAVCLACLDADPVGDHFIRAGSEEGRYLRASAPACVRPDRRSRALPRRRGLAISALWLKRPSCMCPLRSRFASRRRRRFRRRIHNSGPPSTISRAA